MQNSTRREQCKVTGLIFFPKVPQEVILNIPQDHVQKINQGCLYICALSISYHCNMKKRGEMAKMSAPDSESYLENFLWGGQGASIN